MRKSVISLKIDSVIKNIFISFKWNFPCEWRKGSFWKQNFMAWVKMKKKVLMKNLVDYAEGLFGGFKKDELSE